MIAKADARDPAPRLAGLRVLVTRPEEDAAPWADGIAALGGVPILRPALVCETLRDPDTEQRLRAALAACDLLLLTSARAVDAMEDILGAPLTLDVPVATVGPRTTERARRAGLRVSREAAEGSVASLADTLAGAEGRLVHVGAEETRPGLEALETPGRAHVERVAVYRTTPHTPLPPAEREDVDVDVVLLASPSAVRGLVGRVRVPARARIVTLGPSTTAAARSAGLSVAGEAATRDLLGLLRAIPKESPQ